MERVLEILKARSAGFGALAEYEYSPVDNTLKVLFPKNAHVPSAVSRQIADAGFTALCFRNEMIVAF